MRKDTSLVDAAAGPGAPEPRDESVAEKEFLTPTPAAEGTEVPAPTSQLPRAGSLHRAAAGLSLIHI